MNKEHRWLGRSAWLALGLTLGILIGSCLPDFSPQVVFARVPRLLRFTGKKEPGQRGLSHLAGAPQRLPADRTRLDACAIQLTTTEPECLALWTEIVELDTNRLGKPRDGDGAIVIENPPRVVDQIIGLHARHGCTEIPRKGFLRQNDDFMKRSCARAKEILGKSSDKFERQEAVTRCLTGLMGYRYAILRLFYEATPTDSLSDLSLLSNLYFAETLAGPPFDPDAKEPLELAEAFDPTRKRALLKRLLELAPDNPDLHQHAITDAYDDLMFSSMPVIGGSPSSPPTPDSLAKENVLRESLGEYERLVPPADLFLNDHKFELAMRAGESEEMQHVADDYFQRFGNPDAGNYFLARIAYLKGDVASAKAYLAKAGGKPVPPSDPSSMPEVSQRASLALAVFDMPPPPGIDGKVNPFSVARPGLGFDYHLPDQF